MLQDGETALHKAAYWGHVEVVQMLVKYGAAVDIKNKVSHSIDRHHKNIVESNLKLVLGGGGEGMTRSSGVFDLELTMTFPYNTNMSLPPTRFCTCSPLKLFLVQDMCLLSKKYN